MHISTASRALNPSTASIVNPETVERVAEAARKLGYRPHPLARGLRTNRTMSVGVIIPDVENPLFGPIIAGVESVLVEKGYSVLIGNADRGPGSRRQPRGGHAEATRRWADPGDPESRRLRRRPRCATKRVDGAGQPIRGRRLHPGNRRRRPRRDRPGGEAPQGVGSRAHRPCGRALVGLDGQGAARCLSRLDRDGGARP